jgi:hypothetical protein
MREKSLKHFNTGNVWGIPSDVTEEESDKQTPYLAITLRCPSEVFGNITAYGRLWAKRKGNVIDKTNIDAFLSWYKDHPGAACRFRGFFSQYDDRRESRRLSNYTFFSWEPVANPAPRASFVLVGEVIAIERLENEGKLYINLIRPGQDGHDDIEEDFEVFTLSPQSVDGIDEGDIIEAAGYIRARVPEDEFGRPSSDIKPYVMDIKIRRKGKEPF